MKQTEVQAASAQQEQSKISNKEEMIARMIHLKFQHSLILIDKFLSES